jgi:hypothetical protein
MISIAQQDTISDQVDELLETATAAIKASDYKAAYVAYIEAARAAKKAGLSCADMVQALADAVAERHAMQRAVAPIAVDNPDWYEVKNLAAAYIADLSEEPIGADSSDLEHYIFEAVMTAVYGPRIFNDFINKKFK